ncbi:type II toxin-antitoxin system RelE/ParE family toxin [Carnimonas bestiolae]|uniref:type II toxin-antitoxin system RelE/ParE family toxin n=1 Tax=Carnimonas bestiolae TaxID=3402172 RepID=UPI003EDC3264
MEIRHFVTVGGRNPYAEWRSRIRDTKARIAIDRRLFRVELGNLGDHKPCRDGVWELRIDTGPGYRVYYALAGKTVVLLMGGGTKRSQSADIDNACAHWQEWLLRH